MRYYERNMTNKTNLMSINIPLSGGYIGIERETLRTTTQGKLATTQHPQSLGNVYTHPNITIDYGEALLEIVTEAHQSPTAVYQQLLELHQYTAQNLQNGEQLWPASMPCVLPDDPEAIEIGYFGNSNGGKIKRLYRIGLSNRYGRPMQMIAGVHFNYSPPEALWQVLATRDGDKPTQSYKNARYMAMLRNLQRYGWLICHLFGASPTTDKSFSPAHGILDRFSSQTLGWRGATSLRMSTLGYQNKVDFTVSFNKLDEYIFDLTSAVRTPAPAYEYLGLKDQAGNYQQISTHILQIANEYYTAARPKQPLRPNELPTTALKARGVAYIELRLLDNNPYDPCGISLEQIYFLETFMLWALLTPAEPFTHADYNELNHNRLRTACCGLSGQQKLYNRGREQTAQDWANDILQALLPLAQRLDIENHSTNYLQTIETLINENNSQGLRLPEKVQQDLQKQEHRDWGLMLQEKHHSTLSKPLSEKAQKYWDHLRDQSLDDFIRIEKEVSHQVSFDHYLAHYFDPLKQITYD